MQILKKHIRFLIIAGLLCLASGCKDDDDAAKNPVDQLPPATQEGAFTFGCLINGEPFVVTNSYKMVAIYQGGGIQLGFGENVGDSVISLSLTLNDPIMESKTYDLTDIPKYRASFTKRLNGSNAGCFYESESTFSGNVTIKNLDQNQFIISGIFELSTVRNNCDTITITDGRFDLKYIP